MLPVLVLYAASGQQQPVLTPVQIPAGQEVVRIRSGEVQLLTLDGELLGTAMVREGWYFTPLAYERMNTDIFNLELKMENAMAAANACGQVAEAKCAAIAAKHSGYSFQVVALSSIAFLLLGVILGIINSHLPRHDYKSG